MSPTESLLSALISNKVEFQGEKWWEAKRVWFQWSILPEQQLRFKVRWPQTCDRAKEKLFKKETQLEEEFSLVPIIELRHPGMYSPVQIDASTKQLPHLGLRKHWRGGSRGVCEGQKIQESAPRTSHQHGTSWGRTAIDMVRCKASVFLGGVVNDALRLEWSRMSPKCLCIKGLVLGMLCLGGGEPFRRRGVVGDGVIGACLERDARTPPLPLSLFQFLVTGVKDLPILGYKSPVHKGKQAITLPVAFTLHWLRERKWLREIRWHLVPPQCTTERSKKQSQVAMSWNP